MPKSIVLAVAPSIKSWESMVLSKGPLSVRSPQSIGPENPKGAVPRSICEQTARERNVSMFDDRREREKALGEDGGES
jgi:hypothetical protein